MKNRSQAMSFQTHKPGRVAKPASSQAQKRVTVHRWVLNPLVWACLSASRGREPLANVATFLPAFVTWGDALLSNRNISTSIHSAIPPSKVIDISQAKVAHNPSTAPTSGNTPLPTFSIPHLSTNSFALSPFANPTSVAFSPTSNPFISSCFLKSF